MALTQHTNHFHCQSNLNKLPAHVCISRKYNFSFEESHTCQLVHLTLAACQMSCTCSADVSLLTLRRLCPIEETAILSWDRLMAIDRLKFPDKLITTTACLPAYCSCFVVVVSATKKRDNILRHFFRITSK